MFRSAVMVLVAGLLAVSAFGQDGDAPEGTVVRLTTNAGDIDLLMYDEKTPGTVANFLRLVDEKAYDGAFFHRLVPGFVIQGGGFKVMENEAGEQVIGDVPDHGPVKNEPGIENVRGTLAMAKLGGDPDSATNQFFINLGDNRANLDNQNGGFTVFAEVMPEDLPMLDKLNRLERVNANGPFTDLPLLEIPEGDAVDLAGLLIIETARVVDPEAEAVEAGSETE